MDKYNEMNIIFYKKYKASFKTHCFISRFPKPNQTLISFNVNIIKTIIFFLFPSSELAVLDLCV